MAPGLQRGPAMRKAVIVTLLSSLLLWACANGDDDGKAGAHPDARPGGSVPDARPGGGSGPDSAGPVTGVDGGVAPMACAASTDYGEMGALMGDAYGTAMDGFMSISMNANMDPDVISVELYGTYGAFMAAGGIKVGTYMLSGADADYEDCGACVYVYDENYEIYMAASGTLELTNVTDRLTGTLTGVQLRHISFNDTTFESEVAADGCGSHIGRVTFDQTLATM